MDDQGIPNTAQERLVVARRLFHRLTGGGIQAGDIYFDPLVLSIAVVPDAALVTLETIRMLRSDFPGSHTVCGVSNVSMGLPARRLINRTFLSMAISTGLDTLFVDVRDQALLSTVYASTILANQDSYCLEYLQAYRQKKILV
jgi:5-methyltetrahydrofolate--homocysteine methyltransferase